MGALGWLHKPIDGVFIAQFKQYLFIQRSGDVDGDIDGEGAASVFIESICVSPKGSEGNRADDTNKVTAISIT